eukprot:PhF_6_TR41677/c0_g1_i3/m.63201
MQQPTNPIAGALAPQPYCSPSPAPAAGGGVGAAQQYPTAGVPIYQPPQQTIIVQQVPAASNPDGDYLVACCATYCCSCLGCLMYCVKPTYHTGVGMVGGFGCSFIVAGIVLLIFASVVASARCDRPDYYYQNDYNNCVDRLEAAIRIYNGVGAAFLCLGAIIFPITIWKHQEAKQQQIQQQNNMMVMTPQMMVGQGMVVPVMVQQQPGGVYVPQQQYQTQPQALPQTF